MTTPEKKDGEVDVEDRIAQIKKRIAGASPGPWKNDCCKGLCPAGVFAGTGDHPVFHVVRGEWGDEYPVIEFEDGTKTGLGNEFEKYDKPLRAAMDCIVYGEVLDPLAKANGDFIAHSREDIPFLLGEISALKEKLGAFKEIRDRITVFYATADGFEFPNSREGDLIRMVWKRIKELESSGGAGK